MTRPKVGLKAVPLAEFVAGIERRREAAGITELPRNSGKRRTASAAEGDRGGRRDLVN